MQGLTYVSLSLSLSCIELDFKEISYLVVSIFRASNTFCQMACGMLSSLGDFLKMGSDEIIKNMYDLSDDIDEEDSSSRSGLEKRNFK